MPEGNIAYMKNRDSSNPPLRKIETRHYGWFNRIVSI